MFRVSEIRSRATLQKFFKVCMQDAGRVLLISDLDERRLQTATHAVW